MKVSVVIPTHNRVCQLPRALNSVLAQTYRPHEIIVVDDASEDTTGQVLAQHYATVACHRLSTNRGAAHARNVGARLASGDFLAFLDSDDVWLPHKLDTQVACFNAMLDKPDLLGCGVLLTRRSGHSEVLSLNSPVDAARSIVDLHSYPYAPSTWLIQRDIFLRLEGFDENLSSSEDWDLLVRLQKHAKIAVIPDVLVAKYNGVDSLDANAEKRVASYPLLFERHASQWKDVPDDFARYQERLAVAALRLGNIELADEHMCQAWRLRPVHFRRAIKWFAVRLQKRWPGNRLSVALWPFVKARRTKFAS